MGHVLLIENPLGVWNRTGEPGDDPLPVRIVSGQRFIAPRVDFSRGGQVVRIEGFIAHDRVASVFPGTKQSRGDIPRSRPYRDVLSGCHVYHPQALDCYACPIVSGNSMSGNRVMKYAIIIPDGCADEPQDVLGGRTPLQAACIPAMDAVARSGIVGRANHIPEGFTPGSEVANMSLLGYDPRTYFTGRAPLEAAAQGIHLAEHDWAVRCNLVTIHDQVMVDFTAGHISTQEAAELLATLQQELRQPELEFRTGVSYRNLLIWRSASGQSLLSPETRTTAPHDLTDLSVVHDYPRGSGSDRLSQWMALSEGILRDHPVNRARIARGLRPATHIWLWGQGQKPRLQTFEERFGLRGAMITAVDLLRGLAALVGWELVTVPGATGYLDTDYAAKGRFAVEVLDRVDLVCVHIEATDEASHEGRVDQKVQALEAIDRHIVGPVHDALQRHAPYRMLITPDHPTLLRTKMHSRGYVPWALCGHHVLADGATGYDEPTAERSSWCLDDGSRLMEDLVCRS